MKTNPYNQARLSLKLISIAVLIGTTMSYGNDDNYTIIDVRTNEEWNTGRLEDAKHLPVNVLKDKIKKLVPDFQHTIYLYCRSGNRSGRAKQIMDRLGYKHTQNLGSLNEASHFLKKPIEK